MSSLIVATNTVKMDEPCWGLSEQNQQSPGSRGWRRWMLIKVIRNDTIVEFRRNLGPAKAFAKNQFVIPGGVYDPATGRGECLHTVGELVDIAEYLRSDKHRPEPPAPKDLIGAYRDQADLRRRWRWKRSSIGPLARIQRG